MHTGITQKGGTENGTQVRGTEVITMQCNPKKGGNVNQGVTWGERTFKTKQEKLEIYTQMTAANTRILTLQFQKFRLKKTKHHQKPQLNDLEKKQK